MSGKDILVIGNFDGVHIGHQYLIGKAKAKSHGKVCLLNFIPHTGAFFGRKNFFILSPHLREFSLKKAGVEHFHDLPFHQVAELSPLNFVRDVLFDRLNAKSILVGENFRFGKGRSGNFQDLKSLCSACGIEAFSVPTYTFQGIEVSCTNIGNFIQKGDMETVSKLLGRYWTIEGEVLRGTGKGRELGFPTANLSMGGLFIPPFGVYFAYAQLLDEKEVYKTAVSIGVRPTVEEDGILLLEAHVLNFNEKIYGKILKVSLCEFLREERKFPSLEDMKACIVKDINLVNQISKSMDTPHKLW